MCELTATFVAIPAQPRPRSLAIVFSDAATNFTVAAEFRVQAGGDVDAAPIHRYADHFRPGRFQHQPGARIARVLHPSPVSGIEQ